MENIDVSEVKESLKETADDLTAEDLINLDNDQESADEDVIEVNIEKPKEITPQHVSRLLECLNEARDIVTEFDSNIDRSLNFRQAISAASKCYQELQFQQRQQQNHSKTQKKMDDYIT